MINVDNIKKALKKKPVFGSRSEDASKEQILSNIKDKLDSFDKLSRTDIDYIYRVLILLHRNDHKKTGTDY